MIDNHLAARNHIFYGRRIISCLVCQFALSIAGDSSCHTPQREAVAYNASSLLQVQKSSIHQAAPVAFVGDSLDKASDRDDSTSGWKLRDRLDQSILEDARLRRANMDLERRLVQEHDEVQRLKVMVERLYNDKTKDPSKEKLAKSQTENTALHQEVKVEDATPHQENSDFDAPCECEVEGTDWKRPAQRPPRCIFIDLGAADGNTFNKFLSNGFGDVGGCPSQGSYEAILVEANPVFNKPLQSLEKNFTGLVRSVISTAAYMCEGTTSFYLDTVDVQQHFWGSSMSPNARDVQRSGKKKVTVPLMNLNRLLWETSIKEDYVLVKMDIEGQEHDILPCLAKSKAADLVDALYVEQHPVSWSRAGAQEGSLQRALTIFQDRGVTAPVYDSPM
mmetsp:Transcript_783/g.1250  ORF Transcript_783/g.1250 Transcript_783/m.1250 type:complete len:391 (-) Transcript_783:88-1260(-)